MGTVVILGVAGETETVLCRPIWHDTVLSWCRQSLLQPVKFPGLKDARKYLQTVYFRSYNTSTFNAVRFDKKKKNKKKKTFTCQCEKKTKKG